MEEIGLKFLEAREGMDISLEEAAEDLNVDVSEIDNLEKGNIKHFSDVFQVRYLIEKYGKYLGLDYELLVDDFNEYLFDFTSKISLQAIKKAKKEKKNVKDDKLKSPYTLEKKDKKYIFIGIIICFLIIVILFLLFVL